MVIRPVSDLRNHYAEIERDVAEAGPVFLTKNEASVVCVTRG